MSVAHKRIVSLHRDYAREAAYVETIDGDQFRVSPSCPPDKRLHIRPGRNPCSWNRGHSAFDYAEYRFYTVPVLTADLENPASTMGIPTFSTAYYYRLFFFCLRLPAVTEEPTADDWTFYLHGDMAEFETAAEAELHIASTDFLNYNLYDDYGAVGPEFVGSTYQLCGLVLRNDGQVGITGAFQAIDAVNRGRSYIWPRDVRPRQPLDS